MSYSLKERIEEYENAYDIKITKRLPIVIKANIRNYKKISQSLKKPFPEQFLEILANTMLYAASNIQDCIFCYCFDDEVSFVLRNDQQNDQSSWYDNNLQKLCSTVSSLMSLGYYKYYIKYGKDFKLDYDVLFNTKVFALPYLGEVVNYLISRQQTALNKAISIASRYELSRKIGDKKAEDLLHNKSLKERVDILEDYCNIFFYEDYPSSIYRGITSYKIPLLANSDISKNKWLLNYKLSDFTEDKEFLTNILNNGRDVYRASSLP